MGNLLVTCWRYHSFGLPWRPSFGYPGILRRSHKISSCQRTLPRQPCRMGPLRAYRSYLRNPANCRRTLQVRHGQQIYQQSYETFYQIQWRPRRDLLDEVSRRDVVKNLKRYERNFDSADRELRRSRYLAETKGKRKLRSDFRERVAHLRAIRDTQTENRVALMGGYDENDERYYSTRNATVENVVSTKEEIV